MPLKTLMRRIAVIGVFYLLLPTANVFAETPVQSACSKQFDQCLAACDLDFAGEPAKRAACVPTCSGKFAACDAGVAYDKAKPWLEEQARKSKKFFESLIDKYGQSSPEPAPQEKTKDNSI